MSFTLRLRRFHRWHALVMSIVVVMSAGSGLLHTLMARTQPPPPPPRPAVPLALAAAAIAPSALPSRLPAEAGAIVSASLRPIAGAPWWQVHCQGRQQPYWIDAADGRLDDGADARYAAEIASDHLGGAAVRADGVLTAFDSEYIVIFRILPVHRFRVDDGRGTRLYVSTMTGSVTRHTDDTRQFEADVFGNLHKWSFIGSHGLRDTLLMVAMGSLIVLALGGVVLFGLSRRKA